MVVVVMVVMVMVVMMVVVVVVGTPLSNRWLWQDQRHNYMFHIFPMHTVVLV